MAAVSATDTAIQKKIHESGINTLITSNKEMEKKYAKNIKNIDSQTMLRKKLLTFIRSLENDTYGIYDPFGVRLLNRLRLGFNHLREHKFRHSFADILNLPSFCCREMEDT